MPTDFQYAAVPDRLKEFLEKIRGAGIPDKATYKWLESLGYKSTNDRGMLRVLNFIGFVDSSRSPSDYWKRYRGQSHRKILAEAIMQGYQELFNVYPDAHQRSDIELEGFFGTKTDGGKQVISRLVRTFKSLCALADFNSLQSNSSSATVANLAPDPFSSTSPSAPSDQISTFVPKRIIPQITFNIQIVLPENASSETYEKIFKNIATYLLGHCEEQ